MSTYSVTYRLTNDGEPMRGAVLTARRITRNNQDGTYTMRVSVHPGYTEVDDIPRIVATNHPGRVLDASAVELVDVTQTVTAWGHMWTREELDARLLELTHEMRDHGRSDDRVTERRALETARAEFTS